MSTVDGSVRAINGVDCAKDVTAWKATFPNQNIDFQYAYLDYYAYFEETCQCYIKQYNCTKKN